MLTRFVENVGAQGRTRTTDTRIFSPLLYQLSYLGTEYALYSRIFRRYPMGCPAAHAQRLSPGTSPHSRD